MEGYQDTIPLYEQALNAAGTTTQKFGQYQEGTEAAVNRLKASIEGLWQTMLDSKVINGALIGLTELTNAFNNAHSGSNNLLDSLMNLLPIYSSLNLGKDFLKDIADDDAYARRVEAQSEIIFNSFSRQRDEINKLALSYQELDKVGKSGGFSSQEQEKEYLDIQTKLAKLVPTLVEGYDEKGQAILKSSQYMQQELQLAEDIYNQEKQRRTQSSSETFLGKQEEIKNQIQLITELRDELKQATQDGNIDLSQILTFKLNEETGNLNKLKSELSSSVKDFQVIQRDLSGIKLGDQYQKIVDDIISSIDFSGLNFDEQKSIFDEINKNIIAIQTLQNSDIDKTKKDDSVKFYTQNLEQYLSSLKRTSPEIQNFINAIRQIKPETDGASDSLLTLSNIEKQLVDTFFDADKEISELNEALDKMKTGHKLTNDEIKNLVDSYPELFKSLQQEGSNYKLTQQAVEEVIKVKQQEYQTSVVAQRKKVEEQSKSIQEEINNYIKLVTAIQEVITAETNLAKAGKSNGTGLMYASTVLTGMQKELGDRETALKSVQDSLDRMSKLKPGSNTKEDSLSRSKSEYTPLTEQAKELLRIETQLTEVQTKRQQLPSSSQAYRDSLQEEKNLLQEKITLLQKEYEQIVKTQRIGGKSNKIGGSTKDSDEALKKSIELEQQIVKLNAELSNLSFEQVNSEIEEFAEKVSQANLGIEETQLKMQSLSPTSKEYRDNLQKEIDLIEQKQDATTAQLLIIDQEIAKGEQELAQGKLTIEQLEQLKKKRKELNNEYLRLDNDKQSKSIEITSSSFEEQGQIIDQLNTDYGHLKARMSGLDEGSDAYNDSLSKQNSLLIAMRALNEQQIKDTLKEIQLTDNKSARYQDLIKQLNGLRSAQIGYNNALRENQQLRIQRENEKWDQAVQKEVEEAREIKDQLLKSLEKIISTDTIKFDFDSIKSSFDSALLQIKNLQGDFEIDPDVETIISIDDVKAKTNEYLKHLQEINKETESFFKNTGSTRNTVDHIEEEVKYANQLKKELKDANQLLDKKKKQYEQIQKYLEYEISLIEQAKDKLVEDFRKSLEVPITIDWEKVKDDLVDIGQTGKITIGDIVLDLDNATVIGDIPSDMPSIITDITGDYTDVLELTKEIEDQNEILLKQEEIRSKIFELEKQNKKETKEYKDLVKELSEYDKKAIESREKIKGLIEQEVAKLGELREEERAIREEIQERETVYKRQEEAIKRQIEDTKKLYDEQINHQKEKLKLLDDQIEREDRLIERTKLLTELENIRKDKRFEYVNENGELELTYDKGKVAELEEKLRDFDRETQRQDQRREINDEIDRLEEARNSELERLEAYQQSLKAQHDKEITQLNFYLNQNKQLQDLLNSNINKHIGNLERSYNH